MIIVKRSMTDSSRCSKWLSSVLLAVLLTALPLHAFAQRKAWVLPQNEETYRVMSVTGGTTFARDTYLSASRYNGWAVGFEHDSWSGLNPDNLFRYGRIYSSMFVSPMTNRLDGGSTFEFGGSDYMSFLWPAVEADACDLLIGPAVMVEGELLYNRQNSNNPVNFSGYLGAGVCVDNTFRFSLFRYAMALQASLYVPLAGLGFAPDYDQPYYYMYKYRSYGKPLHFVTPFNNQAFTQQVALILPCNGSLVRVGYSFDYLGNNLGGHTRSMGSGMFTLGCVYRFQSKKWDL